MDVEKPGKVKMIFTLMSNRPSTKLWLCFLSNVLAVFDRFNTFVQSSKISTAHKLHGECVRLMKIVLGFFFIKPQLIKEHLDDLTKLKYRDASSGMPSAHAW